MLNNKSNIVYYPSTPQTVYVQAAMPLQQPLQNLYNQSQQQSLQPVIFQPITTSYIPSYVAPQPPNYTSNTNNKVQTYQPPQMWQTGLLECFNDFGICCQGCLCPCCLYGKNVEKFNNSNCLCSCLLYLLCCGPVQHCSFRRDLRTKYNLQQSPCNDCCVAFCCGPCGMCQEAREIKYKRLAKIDGPIEQNMS